MGRRQHSHTGARTETHSRVVTELDPSFTYARLRSRPSDLSSSQKTELNVAWRRAKSTASCVFPMPPSPKGRIPTVLAGESGAAEGGIDLTRPRRTVW